MTKFGLPLKNDTLGNGSLRALYDKPLLCVSLYTTMGTTKEL